NHAQTIWEGILDEVVPLMKTDGRKKVFFDIADPQKRTIEDLKSAVRCMERYRERFDVTLGVNYREACQLFSLLEEKDSDGMDALELTKLLKNRIDVDRVIVHPVKEACGAEEGCECRVDGPFCAEPRLTTGAGDNFNGGFILGQILGLDLEDSLLLGTANSGFYVRNARSAGYRELAGFIADWSKGII
ncbi:MAG: hypothetical protein HUJ73_00925, partial [Eubacterium sp.]|nr:hypothetical protein [Eubacterium sp.]